MFEYGLSNMSIDKGSCARTALTSTSLLISSRQEICPF